MKKINLVRILVLVLLPFFAQAQELRNFEMQLGVHSVGHIPYGNVQDELLGVPIPMTIGVVINTTPKSWYQLRYQRIISRYSAVDVHCGNAIGAFENSFNFLGINYGRILLGTKSKKLSLGAYVGTVYRFKSMHKGQDYILDPYSERQINNAMGVLLGLQAKWIVYEKWALTPDISISKMTKHDLYDSFVITGLSVGYRF